MCDEYIALIYDSDRQISLGSPSSCYMMVKTGELPFNAMTPPCLPYHHFLMKICWTLVLFRP